MRLLHLVLALVGAVVAIGMTIAFLQTPSTQRDWQPEQRVTAHADFEDDLVHITNVRNFTYRANKDFDIAYYNATYNISELRTVEYLVEPFRSWEGISHTMVTFGFADGRHVVVSVEQRREQGEEFSIYRGFLNQYELVYMIADEGDTLRLRTNIRHNTIRMYPLNLTHEQQKGYLIALLERANKLGVEPEFYNAATSTCTTNVLRQLGEIGPTPVPWSLEVAFPGYSDRELYRLGYINTTLSLRQAREHYRIEARARACGNCSQYSEVIREFGADPASSVIALQK